MFIHLLKSRKSHDHLATLHSSSVAQNTCILQCIYTLFCTVIVISFLLHPKVGIPEEEKMTNNMTEVVRSQISQRGGCTMAFTLVQKEETLALASIP